MLIFAAAFGITGCADDKGPYTVTFVMGREDARLAQGYDESILVQTVNSPRDLIFPVFVSDTAYHRGWYEDVTSLKKNTTFTALWYDTPFTVKFEPGAIDAVHVSGATQQTINSPTQLKKPV